MVARYFAAWSDHDINVVREIFDESSTYEITGKRTLKGLSEIIGYWVRNKQRQRNLKVFPSVPLKDDGTSVLFCATFADIEEREQQTVYGHISFEISNGKIRTFTERYHLIRVSARATRSLPDRFRSFLPPLLWRLKGYAAQAAELLLARAATVLVLLMAVVLGFSAFNVAGLPDWLLCNLSLAFSECNISSGTRRQELVNIASRNLSAFTSLFVFLVIGLYWLRYMIRTPISLIPLQAENHDLSVMKRRFRAAQQLTIFGGDFSFVGFDKELRDIFFRLNSARALMLISEKGESLVKAGFGTEPDAIALFEDLKRDGRIYFDRGVPIRCSILRLWHRAEIVYRYRGGGADSFNDLNLCILKGRKEAGPVLELVQKLVDKVAS